MNIKFTLLSFTQPFYSRITCPAWYAADRKLNWGLHHKGYYWPQAPVFSTLGIIMHAISGSSGLMTKCPCSWILYKMHTSLQQSLKNMQVHTRWQILKSKILSRINAMKQIWNVGRPRSGSEKYKWSTQSRSHKTTAKHKHKNKTHDAFFQEKNISE